MSSSHPTIGITMGDPSGVGPEIIVKALQGVSPELRSTSAVIGNLELLDIPGRWGRIDAFGRGRVDVEAR